MRSGTSFFNWTVFKKTAARYWPVWAVWLAVWLLVLPLNLLVDSPTPMVFATRVADSGSLLLPMTVGFACISAMAVFSHLYNSRSANFFGTLPVRREGLFLTHYTAGLAFIAVPTAAVALLTFLVGLALRAENPEVIWYWLAVACGEYLFFYSFAVFCGMFAGHILALPAYYGIFNALAAGLYWMFAWIFSEFYYGFSALEGPALEVAAWFTPVWKLSGVDIYYAHYPASVFDGVLSDGTRTVVLEGGQTLAVYAAAGAVLAAVSFLLYRRRQLETAGDAVAVRSVRPVFKYGVSFCAGLFLGFLTAAVLGGSWPVWLAASVFWAAAGCFIAQMILDKSFKVFKKWKGPAVMALIFCALGAVIVFDLTGFETRIPEAGQVEQVTVTRLYSPWSEDSITFVTEDPERIDDLITLHRAAVERRGLEMPGGADGYVSLKLTYCLRSGATLTRYYSFLLDSSRVKEEGSPAWALERIYSDRELTRTYYGFDRPAGRLRSVYYTNRDWFESDKYVEGTPEDIAAGVQKLTPEWQYGRTFGGMTFSDVDARALRDAVEADFDAGRLGLGHVGQEPDRRRSLDFSYEGDNGNLNTVGVAVPDTATETIAVLERIIPEYLEYVGFLEKEQGTE